MTIEQLDPEDEPIILPATGVFVDQPSDEECES